MNSIGPGEGDLLGPAERDLEPLTGEGDLDRSKYRDLLDLGLGEPDLAEG